MTSQPAPLAEPPCVTVRYWAAARAAAGRSEDVVAGRTVQQVLDAALEVHGRNRRFVDILAVSSILLGDRPVGARERSSVGVRAGDVVEVLPPFAGG